MKKLFCYFLMLSFIAFVSCEKSKEESAPIVKTGSISGLVTDYSNANAPIAGATVTLNTKGLAKTTGSDGRFEFVNIEPGSYTLQVMANNYQATTKQVTVRADQNVNCDFQLDKSSANIDINPMNFSYGKGVSELSFTIKNNGTNQLEYSISNIPTYLTLTSKSGLIAAKGSQAIVATVSNRSSITESVNSQMIVSIGGESFVINIFVEGTGSTGGGDDPGQGTGGGSDDVTRGLFAYFTFDDETATNLKDDTNNGVLMGEKSTFITDTPNSKGKALSLANKEYVNIPKNALDQATAYSISMWVKNFSSGPLFLVKSSEYDGSPHILVDPNMKIQSKCEKDRGYYIFNMSASKYVDSAWHMITITFAEGYSYLYIDGALIESGKNSNKTVASGYYMTIGGQSYYYVDEYGRPKFDNGAMQVDNVRVYNVALTDKEVASIYQFEK